MQVNGDLKERPRAGRRGPHLVNFTRGGSGRGVRNAAGAPSFDSPVPKQRELDYLRTREELNRVSVAAPDVPSEHHHLYRCSQCGDVIDRRSLGDVLLHEEPHSVSLAGERLSFSP